MTLHYHQVSKLQSRLAVLASVVEEHGAQGGYGLYPCDACPKWDRAIARICPNCGAAKPADAVACPPCAARRLVTFGATVAGPLVCPNCGEPKRAKSIVCGRCSRVLFAAPAMRARKAAKEAGTPYVPPPPPVIPAKPASNGHRAPARLACKNPGCNGTLFREDDYDDPRLICLSCGRSVDLRPVTRAPLDLPGDPMPDGTPRRRRQPSHGRQRL